MKALVKENAGPGFALKDVPEPKIRDDEVLIRVRRAGVCGTDVHIYEWDDWAQRPREAADRRRPRVRRRGRRRSARSSRDVQEGDRVTAEGHIVDGRCLLCRTGNAHVCPHTRSSASIAMAASPSTSRCRRRTCGTSTTTCRSTSAASTTRWATRSTRRSPPRFPGATVLVTGCGPIGLFAVGICNAAGASRIIATRRERHAARARAADGRARRGAARPRPRRP